MKKIVIDISDKAYAHTQNLGCIWHQDNKEIANAINDGKHNDWTEVSKMLYLFRKRKWTDQDAKQWLYETWNYLEYGK